MIYTIHPHGFCVILLVNRLKLQHVFLCDASTRQDKVAHFHFSTELNMLQKEIHHLVTYRVVVCIMRGKTGHAWIHDSLKQNKGK